MSEPRFAAYKDLQIDTPHFIYVLSQYNLAQTLLVVETRANVHEEPTRTR